MARNSSALSARLEIANSLEELVSLVKDEAKDLVSQRIAQFKNFPRHDVSNLFSELCFCVLTANWSAQGGMRAQELIDKGFLTMPPEDLEDALRSVGHRFAYQRARFILENRQRAHLLPSIVNGSLSSPEARSMLVKNFKGIGWKEASHFLRNVGLLDVAILDKHILRLMHHYKLIENMPKGWTRARYEAHEQLLIPIAQELQADLGEMDLYLWYAVKNTVDK
ncbi:MAG TPA: DNA lyase [Coprothermobacter sp.]|nr:DNA lyase [Coprothermobacter sp.]